MEVFGTNALLHPTPRTRTDNDIGRLMLSSETSFGKDTAPDPKQIETWFSGNTRSLHPRHVAPGMGAAVWSFRADAP